jgi:uncharacterized protein (DUF924 family)
MLQSKIAVEFEDDVEKVLDFWFPAHLRDDAQVMRDQFTWWFGGGAHAQIKTRFMPLLELASFGALNHWAHFPYSRLALIIVLDQFSRCAYKGTPRMYAQDYKAAALASDGLLGGHYEALRTPWEKTFFFMPLGHAENLLHLSMAVHCAEMLAAQATPATAAILAHSASQARAHRDVVARFGRQPHRNPILGRASTPEELAYIARGEFVHERPIPALA